MPLRGRPRIKRRTFLRAGAAGLAAAAVGALSRPQPAAAAQTTRVVLTKNPGATDESGAGVPAVVKEMVDRTLRELTGKDSIADAWREFVSLDDVVGLKINLRGGRYLSTQPCVVDAIVDGLTAAGVRPNNIIAWDAWTREFRPAKFSINDSDTGVRYLATDRGARLRGTDEEKKETLKAFYSSEPVPVGDQEVYFSKILADEVTALINIPLIKDHRIAGVTCSMKNHYGSLLSQR